jgi:hypothetical protein
MTENFTEMKWNKFEASGKVADYLQYKGISAKTFTDKSVSQHTQCDIQSTEIS